MKKLTDICDIQYGYAFDSKCFTEDSSYPQLVRIRDVKKGYSETYYAGDYSEEYILSEGDLLVGMDGEFNIARWKCSGALLNQRVCKLTAKVGTNEEYLRFAMSKSLKEIEQRTAFVTVKHLSAKELNKLELDVPELSKQDIIADTLSRLERVIEARKEEMEKLDDLIKSRFVEMFGDPVSNPMRWKGTILRTVCSKITDGEHGSVPRVEIGHPFLNAKHVLKNGLIDWASVSFTDDEVHEKLCRRCSPEKNDILMTTTGTIGNIAIVPDMESFSMDRGITLLKLDYELVDSVFIACMLRFDGIQALMQSNVHASAIGHLFLNKVEQIPIILPPLDMQRQFSNFVAQVDKSKVAVQKALEETQLLFDSLMQQYFG